jgi:hypothetical protein
MNISLSVDKTIELRRLRAPHRDGTVTTGPAELWPVSVVDPLLR